MFVIIDNFSISEDYKNVTIFDGMYSDSQGKIKLNFNRLYYCERNNSKTHMTAMVFYDRTCAENKLTDLINLVHCKNSYPHDNLCVVNLFDLSCKIRKSLEIDFDVNNQSIINGLIDSELNVRQYPSNPINAARAGFVAALKYLGIQTKNSFE